MKRINLMIILAGALFLLPACESFLEEKPRSFASSVNLTSSEAGLTQLLHSVYNPGINFWRERYALPYGWPGDDVFKGLGNSTAENELDNYTLTSTNSFVNQKWFGPFQSVTRANVILEGIVPFREGAFKQRVIAETKYLRGMFYFLLVRTFGEVPLLTEYENAEFFPSRAPIPDVYAQIVQDLKDAEQGLPGWQERSNSEIGRATRGAVKSLLGKVYLTMATTPETADPNYFNLAAQKLKEVIDTEGYGLVDNYKEVFEPPNFGGEEDIFSIYFKANILGLNGFIHGRTAQNPDRFGQRGTNRGAITPYAYDKFEVQDTRRATIDRGEYTVQYFDDSGAPTTTEIRTTPQNYPFTWKFQDPNTGRFTHNQTDAMWPLIRYSDVLLMYSEAVNESQGPNAEAYKGIDMVRTRANASELPRGLSQAELREYIREERLLELFAEGHRWFDLKRWGILEERIKEAKPWAADNISWPKHRFFPIPQPELDVNPNLTQNPGYLVDTE